VVELEGQGSEQGSFEGGIRSAITGLLASPWSDVLANGNARHSLEQSIANVPLKDWAVPRHGKLTVRGTWTNIVRGV